MNVYNYAKKQHFPKKIINNNTKSKRFNQPRNSIPIPSISSRLHRVIKVIINESININS